MLSYTPSDQGKFSFGFSRKAQSPNLYERYAWSNNPMAMTMNGRFGDAATATSATPISGRKSPTP